MIKRCIKFFQSIFYSEENYNKIYFDYIVDNLPHFLFWKDANGVFLGCNKIFSDSAHLNSPQEIKGKTDFDMPWRNSADAYIADDKAIMRTRVPKLNYEEYQKQADGTIKLMLVSKVPMLNVKKEVIGILGIYTDISERKEMEKVLQNAKENAEMANQVKSEFIDNMEHDIRTPFTGIWSLASYLETRETDTEKKEYLSDISKSAKQLLDYCDSILKSMKLEACTGPLLAESFNLKTMIENVILMEMPYIQVKGLKISIDYSPDIPLIVIHDQNRIKRLLINLISNSVKFTQEGYIKIAVKIAKNENNHPLILHLIIEDTGAGLPKEKQEYLQTNQDFPTVLSRYGNEGTGLGLRLAKKIMLELGGEIEIRATLGVGTTFICAIPFTLPTAEMPTNA